VCTGDRAVIQAEIVGQGAQFPMLGCGESQIGNRDIKQPDVGRNVNAGVYPLRERCQIRRRRIRLRRGLPSSGGACQRVSAAEERIRSFSQLPCGPLSATVPAIIAARSSFQDHECGSRPARAVRLGQKCWTFPKTGRPNASTRIFTL
jgi:hypothetical protein